MLLTEYLRTNMDRLVRTWVHDSPPPSGVAAGRYSDAQFGDGLRQLLLNIAEGVDDDAPEHEAGAAAQSPAAFTTWGRQHAEARLQQGYSLDDVIAEFCGLRELVLRSWNKLPRRDAEATCPDLLRFNRALDLGMTESVRRYCVDQAHARDLFTGMLVHDLRDPLGTITGLGHVLALAPESLGGAVAIADKLRRTVARMSGIVDEMLEVQQARLVQSLPVSRVSASLLEISRRAVEELRDEHPDSAIKISARGDVTGRWDPTGLCRVLRNLVSNALKYRSPPGSAVRLMVLDRGAMVQVSVSNQGPPLSGEDLVSMFDPMVRRRQHASAGGEAKRGLGLGLYVARLLAVAHGGSLEARSQAGSNVFTMVLPRGG